MDWQIIEEMMDKIDYIYANDATLVSALSGGLWTPKAEEDNSYPYGVYFLVSATPEVWNSMNNPINAVIHFTFYHKADKRTVPTETVLQAFQNAFDDGGDGVSGTYAQYSFETRQILGVRPEPGEPGVMRMDIEYACHAIPA